MPHVGGEVGEESIELSTVLQVPFSPYFKIKVFLFVCFLDWSLLPRKIKIIYSGMISNYDCVCVYVFVYLTESDQHVILSNLVIPLAYRDCS